MMSDLFVDEIELNPGTIINRKIIGSFVLFAIVRFTMGREKSIIFSILEPIN